MQKTKQNKTKNKTKQINKQTKRWNADIQNFYSKILIFFVSFAYFRKKIRIF